MLPQLTRAGKEHHGPCWQCGGEDRFIVFPNGYSWWRQCGWKGDAIQLLRDRDGLSFSEAKRALGLESYTAPASKRRATIHAIALAAAKRNYTDWQKRTLDVLTGEYRELCTECDIVEVAYRAIHRAQELYTDDERSFWTHQLAGLYDRAAVIENDLFVLTYHINEAARFGWWQEEVRHA
jgi:phage/plasmid primase-like uncharacterized protein